MVSTFLYSIATISYKLIDQMESKKSYKQIQSIYHEIERAEKPLKPVNIYTVTPVAGFQAKDSHPIAGFQRPAEAPPRKLNPRFEELLKINKDTVGWLTIPHSNIDYPILQADDNDYYLHHSFEHKKNSAGAIFMDYRNDPLSIGQNTILYGHRMRDGSMFKHLVKYLDNRFFTENPIITFDGLVKDGKWQVFSAYITDTSFNYIQTKFDSDNQYSAFLKAISERSKHKTSITLSIDDKILTLSTCSYEFDNARIVVHAKLISTP
jgi:sortase B